MDALCAFPDTNPWLPRTPTVPLPPRERLGGSPERPLPSLRPILNPAPSGEHQRAGTEALDEERPPPKAPKRSEAWRCTSLHSALVPPPAPHLSHGALTARRLPAGRGRAGADRLLPGACRASRGRSGRRRRLPPWALGPGPAARAWRTPGVGAAVSGARRRPGRRAEAQRCLRPRREAGRAAGGSAAAGLRPGRRAPVTIAALPASPPVKCGE